MIQIGLKLNSQIHGFMYQIHEICETSPRIPQKFMFSNLEFERPIEVHDPML